MTQLFGAIMVVSMEAWYDGPALLEHLETVDVTADEASEQGFYMPVQRVCRPNHEFRGFQGQVESGSVKVGDRLTSLPSGEIAEVKSLIVAGREVETAVTGQPVTIQLNREIDISRGSVLESGSALTSADTFSVDLLWMDDTQLTPGKNFLVRLGTKLIPGLVTAIDYRIDINSGAEEKAASLKKNEIARVKIAVTEPVVLAKFRDHQALGELILIDRITNQTSACGVVRELSAGGAAHPVATEAMRAALNWQEPLAVVFQPAKDGTTLAAIEEAEYYLVKNGRHTYLYHPAKGEDYETTLAHLQAAGLIVLLVLDSGAAPVGTTTWTSLSRADNTPAKIAERILHASMLTTMIAPNNWVI